ncbi:TonB-dependent siderophore receptor [Qipengyuania sp. YG27]|uniref:TonB-dependent siderophore receptor n=1 Tax=Qipengyuania mesophila TaxID=2867246 RepID=A0ABS7JX92_9SPHN|nr:TonB-dependent siderophore receptor [Qipengyuania mesophila]MBX7502224.1 TonB-dependent siderophore receptor [Qipengyuania mesophila]
MRDRFSRAALLAGAAFLATATAAQADDMAQPERDYLPSDIVVTGTFEGYDVTDGSTGTKTPTPLIDVPQAATMITEDQLEDQAITQLNEALRYVPGVSLDTGEGHRDQVYIRGQASTADFYLDGLRDDAQYYRSLYNVARVEVLKGSNALIFGRGGGGGIINRVSKTAKFTGTELGFDASVDSFGAFALSADVNETLSDTVALRLNTTYEEFASHRDFYDGRFIGVSPTASFRLGETTTLTAHYTYDDDSRVTDRGIPSLDDGDANTADGPLRGFDKTFFGNRDFNRATNIAHIARLRLDHEFSDELSVNVSGQFADYDKFYANVVPSGSDGTVVDLGGYTSTTDRQNWIGQANLVWDTDFGGIGSTFLAGFEVGDQSTNSLRTEVDFGGGVEDITRPLQRLIPVPAVGIGRTTNSRETDLGTFSAYVQEQLDFGIVQLVGGLRFDRFDLEATDLIDPTAPVTTDRVDEKWSPRLGVIVKPQESLSLYASYSTSFLPQSGDQFSSLSSTDAQLEPEKFENYELGAKWAITPKLFATAAIFRLDRSNTTAADPANPGFVILTGSSRVEGFEASLAGEILPNWQASLGYTYLDGEIRTDTDRAAAGTPLQQLPTHQIALWNRVDLTENFGLGAGVVYQDEQFASISGDVILPDYVRVDAAAYYAVSERVSIQLNIENLFDVNYYPSAHGDNNIQPAEPFSARIGVRLAL